MHYMMSLLPFPSTHSSLIHYLSFSDPLLSITPPPHPIKPSLPASFYSSAVTNIAFSVNLNRLTLEQATHSDTGSKTCAHALPQTTTRSAVERHPNAC